MKILLVVWNLYPNQAYPLRTLATCDGLNQNGVKADIVTIKPTSFLRKHLLNKWKGSDRNTIMDYLGSIYGVILMIVNIPRYDVIFCSLRNIAVLRIAYFLSHLFNKIIVAERSEHPEVCVSKKKAGKEQTVRSKNLLKKFDRIFVISSKIREYYLENGIRDDKISYYPMVVKTNRFEDLKKIPQIKPYIAYCGAMVDHKDGVADLIQAFGKSKAAKNKYFLKLIGVKPSGEEMEKYQALIAKSNIQGKVEFTGVVSAKEMPQILTDADILVLCRPASKQADAGFPTKLGEYLATGNPVLVTKTGDIPRFIKDGENGFLVNPNDIESFAEKLDYITLNYETALYVGEKGKQLTKLEFNYIEQTKNIIKSLDKDILKIRSKRK